MNFEIQEAGIADCPALAHIHIEGLKAAYGGIVDPDFIAGLNIAARTRDWEEWLGDPDMKVLLARDPDGNPCGLISFGKLRTPIPGGSPIRPLYSSEIYALYILPSYWRQGLGRQLAGEAAVRLKEMKHKSMCLWVLEKNSRAVSFYKSLGGERCGKKDIEIGKSRVREIAFGWRDIDKNLKL